MRLGEALNMVRKSQMSTEELNALMNRDGRLPAPQRIHMPSRSTPDRSSRSSQVTAPQQSRQGDADWGSW